MVCVSTLHIIGQPPSVEATCYLQDCQLRGHPPMMCVNTTQHWAPTIGGGHVVCARLLAAWPPTDGVCVNTTHHWATPIGGGHVLFARLSAAWPPTDDVCQHHTALGNHHRWRTRGMCKTISCVATHRWCVCQHYTSLGNPHRWRPRVICKTVSCVATHR